MSLRTLLFGTFSFLVLWFLGWMAWSIYAARTAVPETFAPFAGTGAWSSLTASQQAMVLAVEDPAFFDHQGLDGSTPGVGATIPQRLAEWLFEGSASPGITNAEHALIAFFVITPLVDKSTQLNAYGATAPLGRRDDAPVHGFERAARVYFRSSLGQISDNQFARLIAMVEDPEMYPMNSDANWERVRRIEAMLDGDCAPLGPQDTSLEGCAR